MQSTLLNTLAVVSTISLAGAMSVAAQTHRVAKPEEVVRAVGVYEWIGDEAKPNASRLIPVTLFVDGELQDAGVYLARPIPLAIDSGTVYEVDKAGVPQGTVDVKYASHLQAADAAANYDDGWFGYGTFAPPPAPKKQVALKESKTPSKIDSSRPDPESDRPTFARRHDSSTPAAPDPKQSSPTSAATAPPANDPADDPDRPHLTRKPDASTPSSQSPAPDASAQTAPPAPETSPEKNPEKTSTAANTASNPPADPDRPTLKKRTPEEAKKVRKEAEESSATGLATSLNDDPNRPTLHRGTSTKPLAENDLPKLKGVPVGLRQAVAVSDAKNRPPHDFSRPWTDDAERSTVLAKMQALARAQLAAYTAQNSPAAAQAPAPARRTPNSKMRRPTRVDTTASVPLKDEQLNGYTLSYGGATTYAYTAHTPGEGAALRYVTVVAQADTFGELQPAIKSVTDAAHLDRTPWMHLIDVVDPDASNRASLLFELRGQSARQFALYRVIAARAEQIFLTGTTQ